MGEWLPIKEETKKTIEALTKAGKPPPVVRRRPATLPAVEWIYEAYFEIDRDDFGRLRFASMVAVLDELEIRSSLQRKTIRRVWRSINHAELEEQEKKREAKRESAK